MATGSIKRGLIEKTYSITPEANSSVSPFSYYKDLDISSDVSAYGYPKSIMLEGGGSTNPAAIKLNSDRTRIWYYSRNSNATTVVVFY